MVEYSYVRALGVEWENPIEWGNPDLLPSSRSNFGVLENPSTS